MCNKIDEIMAIIVDYVGYLLFGEDELTWERRRLIITSLRCLGVEKAIAEKLGEEVDCDD